MPDLMPEGETEAGDYLGIRPKDTKDVQNGMVMPVAGLKFLIKETQGQWLS